MIGMAAVKKNIESAFELAREIIENPEKFPRKFLAIPLDPETVSRLLSKERIRLLRAVRTNRRFESVSKLALELKRDQGRISRDLAVLAKAGLVVVERRGKSKLVRASERPIVLA